MLLPGAVLPAELAYHHLRAALGNGVAAVAKDLELYATDDVAADYSLQQEVDGVLREADSLGWDTFNLVGYSAGGAAALAVTAAHPERVLSLGLLEPAWAGGWGWSEQHRAFWAEQERVNALPDEEMFAEFMRLALAPGVPLPTQPPGPPPAWMALRPAGVRVLTRAFGAFPLEREDLARFDRPVYFALGGRSNTAQYAEIADRLSRVFPDFQLEVFPDRHHFDPPHRVQPEALASSLVSCWERAKSAKS
jgi:pimeloyl-ACP methyl ester carboxylesterase